MPLFTQVLAISMQLSLWLSAIFLIFHTLNEMWVREYRKSPRNWLDIVGDRRLYVENWIVFLFAIGTATIGQNFLLLSLILPGTNVVHPILDHILLSAKQHDLRPGSLTGIFLILPCGIWTYYTANAEGFLTTTNLTVSLVMGTIISVALIFLEWQESSRSH
jgi:lysylphosphatidylglycerol synthetase-like protein (DUF2156 family)